MFQSGSFNEDNPVVSGRHSRKCCILNGGDLVETYNWDGRPKEELSDKCDVVMKAPDVSAEMTLKTEEFGCSKLTETPEMIWRAVRAWCDTEFGGCWHGLLQNQVTELVRKARNKLGKGDTIGTVENTPQYNTMTDTDRPLLHCSLMLPHPKKPNTNMRTMIFANPANLGLLKGPVDLYCDATFAPCTPDPFYQCLIIMIFEYSTSSFVPVLYALMTHKCEELYSQVFAQIVILTGKKIKCRTYTSDFERGLMNQLAEHLGNYGGFHVGCLFHFKQAIRKYLIEKCGLGLSQVLPEAMALGGLDILCVLPRDEVEEIGIPYIRSLLELGIPEWEKEALNEIFWPYFMRQWIPIIMSWNLMSDEGSPVEIVNRTNNALESYNRRFNALFLKQPTLIEFAMIIEKESREQAQIRQDIVTGRKQEPNRKDIWIPTIPESYFQFKEEYYYLGKIDPITTTTSKKKGRKKKTAPDEDAIVEIKHRSKRITRSKAATSKRN